MTRRRVLAFTPGHYEVGGAARRSRLLCEELARRGWEVRAVTRAATASRFRVIRADRIVVLEVPGFGGRRRGALVYFFLSLVLGVVWGARATAIMSVQLASPTLAAAFVSRVTRHPFVVLGSTSGELSEVPAYRSSSLGGRIRRGAVHRASALVAQTDEALGELSSLAPAAARHVLPTPVERVEPLPLSDSLDVLYTGRFSSEKDLPLLLSAWRRVRASLPAGRLVLAGSGGDYRSVEAELRAIVERDDLLRMTVEFPGGVADLGPLLSRCDVSALPSRSEGMSNALVEACAAGRAVVASSIPANVRVLGDDYPLLFPTSDLDELVDRLTTVLTDPRVRAAAAARVTERAHDLLLSAVGGQLEEVLMGAADHSRRQLTFRARRR
jgi:glycosyltransferase involved in cell wall biosynthesis